MGGGGSSAPPPPAPAPFNSAQASADQTKSNVNTAVANAQLQNTNQITPYGNLTYTQGPSKVIDGLDVPSYIATQTLSPEQQGIYDKTTGLQNRALGLAGTVATNVEGSLNNLLNYQGIAELPTDQTALRGQAYDSLMNRFNTDFDRTQAAMDTKLRNQGLQPGSEAYNTQMDALNRTQTDAGYQAFTQAGNIAAQNLSQAQTLRNSAIAERTALRNQPLQDYSTLLGLGGGVSQPHYAPATNAMVAPTDVMGAQLAAYQGQVNNYNQQMGYYNQNQMAARSGNNAMMGGLFGLGGSALGAGGTYLGMEAAAASMAAVA